MSVKCKHNMDTESCEMCRHAIEEEPLPSNALRYTSEREPVLVLRQKPGSREAKVLRLDSESAIVTCDVSGLREDDSISGSIRQDIICRFHEFALSKGLLFHPQRALAYRELTAEGAPHCYHCKKKLSYERGSIGCVQCERYVCDCGRCLCGTEGINWQGQFFGPLPPLPIERNVRLEFVRAVNYCRPRLA